MQYYLIFFQGPMNIEDKTSKSEAPSEMCKTCKRFWANVNFGGLCSKCYNDSRKDSKAPVKEPVKQDKKEEDEKPQRKMSKGIQQNTGRCFECKKKIGLLGVQCKCGYVYCNAHRLPEEHECDWDHEKEGKRRLKKDIVKVAHDKIEEV